MHRSRLIVAAILAISAVTGCKRRQQATPATAPAAPGAAHVAAATQPSTQPIPAYIWIDQRRWEFPPARLVLRTKDDRVVGLLFSDDPPNAIDEHYTGNSFYLEMPLDTPAGGPGAPGSAAEWLYKAPNSERNDTIAGIFLQGRRWHLQPFDVRVDFDGSCSPCLVQIAGQFLMFDMQDDLVPGQIVPVRAELEAELKVRSSGR